MSNVLWVVVKIWLILQELNAICGDVIEDKLYNDLIRDYEKDIRPALTHNQRTNVTFGFLLNQIVDVDERNQVLTTRSWLNINWLDYRLTWNKSDYHGIGVMYFPHQRLWKPDIILTNNADPEYNEAIISTHISVTSLGNVTWLFSAIFRSSCQIKVRYYPFDDQECALRFACWSHHKGEIDMNILTEKGDLSSYINNSEFHLMGLQAKREVISFPCCKDLPWTIILVSLQMRRRPLFYVFNHILPCILITSMALLGFYVPPDTGEKVTMCITTMLSMGVYLKTVTESIPPTAEAAPLIGVYYVVSLAIVCLATTANVWTLNVHRSGTANHIGHVPPWMRKWILGHLATVLHIEIHDPDSLALLKAAKTNRSTMRKQSKQTKQEKAAARTGYHQLRTSVCASVSVPPKLSLSPHSPFRRHRTSNALLKCDCKEVDYFNQQPYFPYHVTETDNIGIEDVGAGGSQNSNYIELPVYNSVRVYKRGEVDLDEKPRLTQENRVCFTAPENDTEDHTVLKTAPRDASNSSIFSNLPGTLEQLLNKPSVSSSRNNIVAITDLDEDTKDATKIAFETQFRRILRKLYRTLGHNELRQAVVDERARIMWEWQQMAVVIDRMLLYIFFAATVLATFFMLVEPVVFGQFLIF